MEGESLRVPEAKDLVAHGGEEPVEGNPEALHVPSGANAEVRNPLQLRNEDEAGGYEALYSASEPSVGSTSGNSSDIDEEETIFDASGAVGETVKMQDGDDCPEAGDTSPQPTSRNQE